MIKTDTENDDGTIELGLHDLAGNPLDQEFSWTVRTKDSPFEETWAITLSATDGTSTDGNNIAAVAFNGLEGEDEMDAPAIPPLTPDKFRLVFVNQDVEYERDIRNADGRLSHHWFFVVENAKDKASVTVTWELSIGLTRDTRQYQGVQLVEFDKKGDVQNVIPMVPADGQVGSYTYTSDKEPRYFRIDVQKAPSLVAKNIEKGSSGWIFFSVPITPTIAEPFINLGDDIDPFMLYEYVTETSGYQIYPAERWDVALQTAHGYFTRVSDDVEIDVGGALNLEDKQLSLETPGWHAIGNPFILPVKVKDLQFTLGGTTKDFDQASKDGWIEDRLYWWETKAGGDKYHEVKDKKNDKLEPWRGHWLRTKVADLTLTIPAPPGTAQAQPEPPDSLKPPLAPGIPEPLVLSGNQGFDLRLALMSSFALDVTTALGTRPDAKVGYDAWDTGEPPMLSQTVSVYFEHEDWDDNSGQYNTDYQPILKAGETRTWRMVVFTDKSGAKMTLSWDDAIGQLPQDTMFAFRQVDTDSDWQDMRIVRKVELMSDSRITKIPFEIRATQFKMSPPADVSIVAGEGQVELRWAADSNPFIDGYIIAGKNG